MAADVRRFNIEIEVEGEDVRVIGVSALPAGAPEVPQNLTLVESDVDFVTITWDNQGDAQSWTIIRDSTPIDTTTSPPPYTDNTVSADTSYDYQVEASNLAGSSGASATLPVTTDAQSAPDTPTGLVVQEEKAALVRIAWDSDPNAVEFDVVRDSVVIDTVDISTYTDTGVAPSTSYDYQIVARNSFGDSSACSVVVGTTLANSAPVWSGMDDRQIFLGQSFSLNLNDQSDDADGDERTYSLISGSVDGLALVDSIYSGTPTTVQTVSLTFRVSDGIDSSDITVEYVVLDPDVTAPSVPDNVIATVAGSTVTIDFDASTDGSGVQKYLVYRNGVFRDELVASPYVESGVPDGTYNYTVSAVDSSANENESAQSAAAVAVVQVTPPAPDSPIYAPITIVSSSELDHSWSAGPSGASPTRYTLEYSLTGADAQNPAASGWTSIFDDSTPPLGTTYDHTGLSASTQYYYRIRAYNGATPSAQYATRSRTTAAVSSGATYDYTSLFDPLTAGRAIDVIPGGYPPGNPGDASDPNGWQQQTCDNLGDSDAPSPDNNANPPNLRGNYPWSAQVVTSGQTACAGYRTYATANTLGTLTNVFPVACVAPRKGSKCLRMEYRPAENPLGGSGPRTQFRRSGAILPGQETWIGFSNWFPSKVGNAGNTSLPIGPEYHIMQIFDDGGLSMGPVAKITMNTTAYKWWIKANDGSDSAITSGGFGGGSGKGFAVPFDQWVDWVIRIKRNPAGSEAILQVWCNGVLKADYTSTTDGLGGGASLGNNSAFLICLYNAPSVAVWSFFDEIRIARASQGGSFDTVNPANF